MGFRAAVRSAAVQLLEDYAADERLKLQVYRARPRSINPPCAFVDSIREERTFTGHLIQRVPTADVVVLHGLYDSGEAVDQGDAFVDGFLAWVDARYHAAGAATLVGIVLTEDDPTFVPDWLPPELQRTYYGTRFSLEGLALD